VAIASCGSTGATPDRTSSSEICSWLTKTDGEQATGELVSPGEYDSISHSCSYQFFGTSGVNTDLVVARDAGPLTAADLAKGRTRIAVSGVGDRAVFYRAKTLDDGNSVMIATKGTRSVFLSGEFLTLAAARQLAKIVLLESN
jgi:hypothetical protein